MPRELIVPATVMSLAFVFYTAGVWSERIAGDLRPVHVALFWLGLGCDGFATRLMEQLVAAGDSAGPLHTITGFAAFGLMAIHAIWATVVVRRGDAETRARYHRFSVVVWLIWLVPYFGGMALGISRGLGR
jgi:uncharacterized repeat protein (TIGR03987 family)